MSNKLDVSILEDLGGSQKDLQSTVRTLLSDIENYLDLPAYFTTIEIVIMEKINAYENMFDLGVVREINGRAVTLKFNREFVEFVPFIILREVFNCFVPLEIRDYEVVQLSINRILTFLLSKHKSVPVWDRLIREKTEKGTNLSTGWNYLTSFDRLINFFRISHPRFKPIPFFFRYIYILTCCF